MNRIYTPKTGGAVCLDGGEAETLETEFPPFDDSGALMAHINARLKSGCVYHWNQRIRASALGTRAVFLTKRPSNPLTRSRTVNRPPLPMDGVSTCVVEGREVPTDCADPRIICAILRWGLLFRKERRGLKVDATTAARTLNDLPSHSQTIQWLVEREFPPFSFRRRIRS